VTTSDGRVDLVLVFDYGPADDEPGRSLHRRGWNLTRGSRRWRRVIAVATALALVALVAPVFVLPIVQARLVTRFVALGVGLLGLQFVVGKAGQLSLCHGVYVGLGSYTTAILVGTHRWPYLLGVACSPVIGFAGGCLVGLLALRIRSVYLGPVTLSVAVAFPMIVKRFGWLTGGSSGLPILHGISAPSFVPPEKTYEWLHLVVVGVALLAFVVARNLVRSPVGLAVDAVATDPLAAASYGINVGRYRLVAAGVGAAFGALGGSLLVLDTPIVGADSYDLFRSLGYYAAVVVGGAGSPLGAILGSALYTGVPFILSTYGLLVGPNLVFGALLLSATFVAPAGLTAALGEWVGGFLRVEEKPPPGEQREPTGRRRNR
jgi:branched-chain amino acid transport system permease protein